MEIINFKHESRLEIHSTISNKHWFSFYLKTSRGNDLNFVRYFCIVGGLQVLKRASMSWILCLPLTSSHWSQFFSVEFPRAKLLFHLGPLLSRLTIFMFPSCVVVEPWASWCLPLDKLVISGPESWYIAGQRGAIIAWPGHCESISAVQGGTFAQYISPGFLLLFWPPSLLLLKLWSVEQSRMSGLSPELLHWNLHFNKTVRW